MKARKLFRSQSGAAIVEFALIAPVLIMLVIGLIEIGRYTYLGIVAAHAAEAGAVYAAQTIATSNDNAGTKIAVNADASGVTWTVNPNPHCTEAGATVTCPTTANTTLDTSNGLVYYVTVQVTANFTSLLHYPGIPDSVPVTASSTMRVLVQ
ncbi:MAG TPA: TadE/TadG family type IV pilus assembly protein [Candidatus Cybelea sp.]|nr:TadE/TadG family type IV pilus assembly protein [Candidatus Cybelea sp.]